MQNQIESIKTILSSLEIPVAYNHFNQPTQLPYIVFNEDETSNVFADDNVYFENVNSYSLELYTEIKDVELEDELKTLLQTNDITYEKNLETYISDERMYEISYSINL